MTKAAPKKTVKTPKAIMTTSLPFKEGYFLGFNYRKGKETRFRRVRVFGLFYGTSPHHVGEGFFLRGEDLEEMQPFRAKVKDFALKDITDVKELL